MIKNFEKSYVQQLQHIAQNLSTSSMRCKHAAMLTIKSRIASIGVNKAKSDPLQKEYSRSPALSWLHAEIDCLKNTEHMPMHKATLIVVRADAKGNLTESCPCTGCQRLIDKLKIPRIIYSNASGELVEVIN